MRIVYTFKYWLNYHKGKLPSLWEPLLRNIFHKCVSFIWDNLKLSNGHGKLHKEKKRFATFMKYEKSIKILIWSLWLCLRKLSIDILLPTKRCWVTEIHRRGSQNTKILKKALRNLKTWGHRLFSVSQINVLKFLFKGYY